MEENEHPTGPGVERLGGSAVLGSGPSPAVNGLRPGDRTGVPHEERVGPLGAGPACILKQARPSGQGPGEALLPPPAA